MHSKIPHLHRTLSPLAALYAAGVKLRNRLFDSGLLPVEVPPVPVISVGNLTVGGTGKTPHIEWLAGWLSHEYRVAVLSRGYRRKTRGFLLATPQTTAAQIGDEPYQIHRKMPAVTVAVDSNRRRGIARLLAIETPPQVILLDDAHQHRYVQPSLAIVLSDYNRPVYADMPLPAGRLREPIEGLQRAHAVVITKCPHALTQEELEHEAALLQCDPACVFSSTIVYDTPRRLTDGSKVAIENLAQDGRATIVSGIANPTPLHNYLRQYYPHAATITFADHHNFTASDIERLANNTAGTIVTTEKDAARLTAMQLPQALRNRIYVLPMTVQLHPSATGATLTHMVQACLAAQIK